MCSGDTMPILAYGDPQLPLNTVLLPFVPGYAFPDRSRTSFHRRQTLINKGGHILPRVFCDSKTLNSAQVRCPDVGGIHPKLIYGQLKRDLTQTFVPAYCAKDKKILRFYGYFKQSLHDHPDALYSVRPVSIYYFLENDSILVYEPPVENSGIDQGKLIGRQRIPKNDAGEPYCWKDLNVGMTVFFFGLAIRITDCDRWTANFLTSEGIEVNPVESVPADPIMEKRVAAKPVQNRVTKSPLDSLQQFLTYDTKVLRFYCLWDNRNSLYGELKPYTFLYFLADDTIEIREIHVPNDGCDPVPILLHRQKLPRDYQYSRNIVLEPIPEEMDFYTAKDLAIGKTVNVMGRNFLLYDCDKFTQNYYRQHFGITDFTPIPVKLPTKDRFPKAIAPYSGWGTVEDSLQSCLRVRPRPPPKDVLRILEKGLVVLRYEAELQSVYDVDQGRSFIISYYPSDFTMKMYERPATNSGFLGGPFMRRARVMKPDSDPNNPEYYMPKDFDVGKILQINRRLFRITTVDKFVEKFREQYPDDFGESRSLLPQPPKNVRFMNDEEAGRLCSGPDPGNLYPSTYKIE